MHYTNFLNKLDHHLYSLNEYNRYAYSISIGISRKSS